MPDDFRPLTYDRGFKTLFEDSVYLLLASEKETDNDMSNVPSTRLDCLHDDAS